MHIRTCIRVPIPIALATGLVFRDPINARANPPLGQTRGCGEDNGRVAKTSTGGFAVKKKIYENKSSFDGAESV